MGQHIGLGTEGELGPQTTGYTTQAQMGVHATVKAKLKPGLPQGMVQGVYAGNMCALPGMVLVIKHYKRYVSSIMGTTECRWVDDTFAATINWARGPAGDHPMQGVLVDRVTYDWAIHQIDNPRAKMQYWAKYREKKILNPTKEKRMERMARFWVDDTEEHRADTLEGATVTESTVVHTYMGCTLSCRKGAHVTNNMEEIHQDTQEQLEQYKAAPAAAQMAMDSKVATKWYAVYTAYRPTREHHGISNALLRQCYKTIGGISRHTKVEALFAPQEDSGTGLADATTRNVEGVQREWIRNMYQALDHFCDPQRQSMQVMHLKYGGCPAVLVPDQRHCKHVPHLWAGGIHDVVTPVGLLMWLPGDCCKGSHIILRAGQDMQIADKPIEEKWDTIRASPRTARATCQRRSG